MTTIPRGVIANNPFDLMFNKHINWRGLTPVQDFLPLCEFTTPLLGLRAGMIDARTKVYQHHYQTLATFIPVFAPPIENDTEAYIQDISNWLGIGRYDNLDLSSPEKLMTWSKCIVRREVGHDSQGKDWYPDATYLEAARMALDLSGR